ncbi:hypothetical protein [Bacteroides sp. 51]|uniref:hypothetical protein n=1 Tax=Bacteroides sp. 51 TaxID=2302938 RepID=UPI0013D3AD1E|nr:hypothetical protein [Bacteroides sp. 51]
MKHLLTYIFAFILGGLLLGSCQQDDKVEQAEEQAGLYISIGAFGNNSSTRAVNVTTESKFNKFTVLYFRKLDNDKYYLMDREDLEADPSVNNGEGNHRLSRPFTTWMGGPGNAEAEEYENMKVVVVANLTPSDITAALGSLTYPIAVVDDDKDDIGTVPSYVNSKHDIYEMETILKKLTFGTAASGAIYKGGKTGTGTGETGNYIPMYVCSEPVTIKTKYTANTYIDDRNYNNSAGFPDIADRSFQLMRSVAKVSITNKNVTDKTKLPKGKELKTFQIYDAYIEHGNSLGYIYHSAAIVTGTDASNNKIGRVIASSVPTTDGTRNKGSEAASNTSAVADGNKISIAAVDTDDQSPTYDQQVFTPFYLYEVETEAPTDPNDLSTYPAFKRTDHCHIVLRGFRDGKGLDDPDTDDVDETDLSELKTYLIPFPYLGKAAIPVANFDLTGSVLRNHHYDFTIDGVTDLGLYMSLSVRPWTDVTVTVDPIPVPD